MARFYADVIGLEPYARRALDDREIVFFKIADGFAGHTAVLALFPRDAPLNAHDGGGHRAGPLHHLALTVPWDEQAAILAWYDGIGQPHRVIDFEWVGWRGVFTQDPEGNTVELVAAVPHGAAA